VLSPRPGRVIEELQVGLPRPRARTDTEVSSLRERALRALGMAARA
jgi:ABC-type nitrate/sulfonate/bicarbonate transport system ATPase subunit